MLQGLEGGSVAKLVIWQILMRLEKHLIFKTFDYIIALCFQLHKRYVAGRSLTNSSFLVKILYIGEGFRRPRKCTFGEAALRASLHGAPRAPSSARAHGL